MNFSDLRNLDPANIGSWPVPIRALVILLLCAAVLGAGYYFDTQNQLVKLNKEKEAEIDLRKQFENKQAQAASLEPLKRQLREMNESFGALLRLLPNRTEIEGLLVDISKSGLAAGLEFEVFRPTPEEPADFYAIQPIQITVTGDYHKFGEFISAVAALPRIVTVHDINISPVSATGPAARPVADTGQPQQRRLSMGIVAKTYRYLDEGEG